MFVANTGTFQVADFLPEEPITTVVERSERQAETGEPMEWQVRISQGKGHVLVLRLTAKQWFSIVDASKMNPMRHVMMEACASLEP